MDVHFSTFATNMDMNELKRENKDDSKSLDSLDSLDCPQPARDIHAPLILGVEACAKVKSTLFSEDWGGLLRTMTEDFGAREAEETLLQRYPKLMECIRDVERTTTLEGALTAIADCSKRFEEAGKVDSQPLESLSSYQQPQPSHAAQSTTSSLVDRPLPFRQQLIASGSDLLDDLVKIQRQRTAASVTAQFVVSRRAPVLLAKFCLNRSVFTAEQLLEAAVAKGCVEACEVALRRCANSRLSASSVLSKAIEAGFRDVYGLLLRNGANFSRNRGSTNPSLYHAARHGDSSLCDILISSHGANVHYKRDLALRTAAWYGHYEVCQYLLNRGADIGASDHEALRRTSRHGRREICELLLRHGANVHAANDEGLGTAARFGYREICELLLQYGADVHAQDGWVLRWAAAAGHLEVCELLLQHGANVHAQNDGALLDAARRGNREICELLLKHGADVHTVSEQALQVAARFGYRDVCEWLLQHGADVHSDNEGALLLAAGRGHREVCELLLQHGADVHARNGLPLRHAIRCGHREVCELLLQHGANVHADNEEALRRAS